MKRIWLIAIVALAVVAVSIGYRTAEGKQAPAAADRKSDEAAIRKTMDDFRAAFEAGDSAAAASFLTEGAELIPDENPPVRGRDAIRKAFADHFVKSARPKLTLSPDALRFPSRDTAVEEGRMTVKNESPDGETTSLYSANLVREDGKWFLSAIREWDIDSPALNELNWLIGTWSAKRADAEVQSTYEWFGNKSFIKASFAIREKDKSFSGMQLIGTDPITGDLRTWTFEHDGGFGEGTCTRDGFAWVFEMTATQPGGEVIEVSNILVPVDKDTFTWQPIDLTIGGEQFGNLAPMKVKRVKK